VDIIFVYKKISTGWVTFSEVFALHFIRFWSMILKTISD